MAKQWHKVCSEDTKNDLNKFSQTENGLGESLKIDLKDKNINMESNSTGTSSNTFSANNFLKAMVDEHRHGNDRYISRIWQKFHPKENSNSSNKVTKAN